ncbi:hypothetical protein BC628DRAFT_1423432 [Trametes gibbosa]|nr:hypothetical protein BC628DRAFT_1423432 [Trametes gibbosa]
MEEHEPGTSASTIRGLRHLDMALVSDSTATHEEYGDGFANSPYHPPSPLSAYQSEPGSPSGDSVSSFPSVSSSFLFSSGPASPPHLRQPSEPDSELGDSTSGLVIPSLTLPSPSRKPTPYGQTLGELRLLVLGPKGADASAIVSQLVDENEDVVEVGLWEDDPSENGITRGKRKASLRVSTHWIEHRDAHGLERIEPARNVEIIELPSYDPYSEVENIAEHILPVIHSPFHRVLDILNREHPPSGAVAHLLSSSSSPLYTALILLACPSPLSAEKALIDSLSPHIPIVVLPTTSSNIIHHSLPNVSYEVSSRHLSSFRPTSVDALRTGLFRTPSTLAALRAEAAARFLRWREVERAVERVHQGIYTSTTSQRSAMKTPKPPHTQCDASTTDTKGWWDKGIWEAQWEGELSQEVALHLRRRRAGTVRRIAPLSSLPIAMHQERNTSYFRAQCATEVTIDLPMPRTADDQGLLSSPSHSAAFDPLHLPSLFVFSFSVLGALRTRIFRSMGFSSGGKDNARRRAVAANTEDGRDGGGKRGMGFTVGIGLALVSAFCAGVGIGLFAARF